MSSDEQNEKLRAITDRFYVSKPTTILGAFAPPFDVSKPNLHDNKKEFLAEKNAVNFGLANIESLLELLVAEFEEKSVGVDVGKRIKSFVDVSARSESQKIEVETAYDLVRRNASEVGLSTCLAFQLIDFRRALRGRKIELMDQEKEFWSGNSRPPNHYARTISLRFARNIANNTFKKPTFGTSRDGGHPSTDFGRALEEVFEILEIKASVKNAARWAIGQLTDEDFLPPMGSLFGLGGEFPRNGMGAFRTEEELKNLLKKGPDS